MCSEVRDHPAGALFHIRWNLRRHVDGRQITAVALVIDSRCRKSNPEGLFEEKNPQSIVSTSTTAVMLQQRMEGKSRRLNGSLVCYTFIDCSSVRLHQKHWERETCCVMRNRCMMGSVRELKAVQLSTVNSVKQTTFHPKINLICSLFKNNQ